jgi:hypothetical protein
MKLYHFYHLWVSDQNLNIDIALEHIRLLGEYGLLEKLDGFYIGLVGSKVNRDKVKELLSMLKIPHTIIIEADQGFEQITQNELYRFSTSHDGYVLYAHNKGAFNQGPRSDEWRRSMTYYTVVRWKESIELLKTVDAVGSHWLTPKNHEHRFPFFAGTFWWAHLSYIKTLGFPDNDNRYGAEIWIGKTPSVRIYDWQPNFNYYGYPFTSTY